MRLGEALHAKILVERTFKNELGLTALKKVVS